jgi:serine/threonine-protein kinase
MGEPFLVVPGGSEPSVSSDGSLLYYVGEEGGPNQVVWVDETGTIQEALGEQDEVFSPSLSPDGRRVAVSAVEGKSRDIWVWDLERGSRNRLTFGDDVDGNPIWMPGGDRILYVHHGEPSTIRSVPADGSAEPTDLFPGTELSMSADGTWIAFVRWSDETLRDVWGVDVREASEPFPVVQTSADELNPAISPDGSLLAYRAIESGRDQVHLRRFPGGEGRWQVSTTGGTHSFWSPTGDCIFYVTDDHLAAVAVASLTPLSLSLGRPETLFEYAHGLRQVREYDPVGKRFLGTALAGDVERVAHPLRHERPHGRLDTGLGGRGSSAA